MRGISLSLSSSLLVLAVAVSILPSTVWAQAQSALPPSRFLTDRNRNGNLEVIAFGDSITRGVGDKPATEDGVFLPFEPREEAGYPLRLEQRLGFNIQNFGNPGEYVTTDGVGRFIRATSENPMDVALISGGSNDSRLGASRGRYFHAIQKMINVASVRDIQVILVTPPPECCNHIFFAPLVEGYIEEMRGLALANQLPLADTDRAFRNTCNVNECELLNLPEGLHPNDVGYDVMSEVVLAALFELDIFTGIGQQEYETAFGLAPGSVVTMPDAAPTPTPTAL